MTRLRGFTLLEIMVALVVGSLLSALVFATVAQVHKVARGRAERAGLLATLRSSVMPVARELESAGADSIAGPDIALLTGPGLTLRAGRGLWTLCALGLPDTLIVARPGGTDWAPRSPVPGRDSVLLYVPGDSTGAVDAWLPLPVVAGPFAGTCPGGSSGSRLVTVLDSTVVTTRAVTAPSVIRVFEVVSYRLYGSGGTWQLGYEGLSAGASLQPVAGPLFATGLDFAGLTRTLGPAGALPNVATIRIGAAGPGHRQSAVGPGQADPTTDSLHWLAPLRNVP